MPIEFDLKEALTGALTGESPTFEANSLMAQPDFVTRARAGSLPTFSPVRQVGEGTSLPIAFLKSAFSSGTKELIGGLPDPDVDKFRAENPWMGLGSQIAGELPFYMIPMMGSGKLAFSLASKMPVVKKFLPLADRLRETAGFGFREGALREIARFAPFEAARIGGSVFSPDEGSVGRAAQGALFSTIGVGAIGGGIGKLQGLRAARNAMSPGAGGANILRKELDVQEFVGPAYNMRASAQQKLQVIDEALKKTPSENPITRSMDEVAKNLRTRVRGEAPVDGESYVQKLPAGRSTATVNRLYESLGRGLLGITPRTLMTKALSPQGFDNALELKAIQDVINPHLPKSWENFTQYLRHLGVKDDAAKDRLLKILDGVKDGKTPEFRKVGDDSWIIQETGEGLYVGVQRVKTPGVRNPKTGRFQKGREDFILFKTTEPQKWFDSASSLTEANAKLFVRGRGKFTGRVNPDEAPNLAITDKMWAGFRAAMTSAHAIGTSGTITGRGAGRSTVKDFAFGLIPRRQADLFDTGVDIFRKNVVDTARGAFAPAHLESDNPTFHLGLDFLRKRTDATNKRVLQILQGEIQDIAKEGHNIFGALIGKAFSKQSFRDGGMLNKMEPLIPDGSAAQADFWRIELGAVKSIDEAKALGLNPDAIQAAEIQAGRDIAFVKELNATADAIGLDTSRLPSLAHYKVANTWQGDFRIPIFRETGGVVGEGHYLAGYGAGFTPAQAADDANRIAKAINAKRKEEGLGPALREYKKHPSDFQEGRDLLDPSNYTLTAEEARTASPTKRFFEERSALDFIDKDMVSEVSGKQLDMALAAQLNLSDDLTREIMETRANQFLSDPNRFDVPRGKVGELRTRRDFGGFKEIRNRLGDKVVEQERFLTTQTMKVGPFSDLLRTLQAEDPKAAERLIRRWNSANGIRGPDAKMVEEFIDRPMAWMFGPRVASRFVRQLNRSMFFLTLGAGDMGFITLNALTPIQTVLPEIAFTLRAATQDLEKYYSHHLVRDPDGVKAVSFIDPLRIMKNTFKEMMNPSAETAKWVNRALDDQIIGRPYIEEVLQKQLGSSFASARGLIENIEEISKAPVAASEEASRAFAYITGRNIGRDFFKMTEDQAHEFGRQFTMRTMYGYGTVDRPRIITGAIGSGYGLFKNWTFNYMANMGGYIGQASRGNWEPLAFGMLGTGAVAGMMGVPGYGMADKFSEIFTNAGVADNVYSLLGNDNLGPEDDPIVADLMLYGFPSLLGFSMQGRAAAPGATLMRDMAFLANSAHTQRAAALGQMFTEGGQALFRGDNPLGDQQFRNQLALAFAPRTLQKGMVAFAEDGIRSLHNNNKMLPAISLYDGIAHTLGMTPLEIEKSRDLESELWNDKKALRANIQELGDELADSWEEGNFRRSQFLVQRAFSLGVPLDSVVRSAKSRMSKRNSTVLQRQFSDYITLQRAKARGVSVF